MARLTVTLLALFLYSSQVTAWTTTSTFENGTPGTQAVGSDAFGYAFKYTVFTSDIAHTGKKSAQVGIKSGTDGWGDWGGSFHFPSKLYEGDEIWFRTYIYYPKDFDFTASGRGMKTMRIHKSSKSGENEGYFDVLRSNEGGALTIGSEFLGVQGDRINLGDVVPKGTWQAYEMYVKFSSVSGGGIYRVWQNGKLIFEDTASRTLTSSSSKADFIYMWTYWNGKAPKTQNAYIDDVVITSDKPGQRDSHGNPYIGLVGGTITSPPKPPEIK